MQEIFRMNDISIEHTAHVLGLADLTQQEVIFVRSLLRGLPLQMAAKQSGVPESQMHTFVSQPHVASVLSHMRETMFTTHVEVNRDMLNLMLFEAHAKSANSTEEIMAIRELAKINGLNAPTQTEVKVTRETRTSEQLRRMSSEELARLAGDDEIVDAEWEDISDA